MPNKSLLLLFMGEDTLSLIFHREDFTLKRANFAFPRRVTEHLFF